jgi:putative phosphoesterase
MAFPDELVVGLISDTHGLLRAEAVHALGGSDFIIHAGDIGDPAVLRDLSRLAPVTAVRGNVDGGAWASSVPETQVLGVGAALIYVLHDVGRLSLNPAAAGFHAVIFGHSHRPERRESEGVLFVNPGSAGPRRFRLPITVGRLRVAGIRITAELIGLEAAQV